MEWKLIDIKKETEHKFLNFYTLTYEVKDKDTIKTYPYYMCSRKDTDSLRAKVNDYSIPDGVIIILYKIIDNKVNILITKQFRPACGTFLNSFTAGLIDKNEDMFTSIKREAKEESGAIIKSCEVIAKASLCATGISDEMNAMVLCEVDHFEDNSLEEFEDIETKLIPLSDLVNNINTSKYNFPLNTRLALLYLKYRFSDLL